MIVLGLVGPKLRAEAVSDGQRVNIPVLAMVLQTGARFEALSGFFGYIRLIATPSPRGAKNLCK